MLISYLANRVTPLPFKSLSGKRLKLAHNSETIFSGLIQDSAYKIVINPGSNFYDTFK